MAFDQNYNKIDFTFDKTDQQDRNKNVHNMEKNDQLMPNGQKWSNLIKNSVSGTDRIIDLQHQIHLDVSYDA